jgi:hypothetical protein
VSWFGCHESVVFVFWVVSPQASNMAGHEVLGADLQVTPGWAAVLRSPTGP